jgi:hypothetical protein
MYVPFLHLPLSFVFTGCESKAHFDGNPAVSLPQLVGDPYWTGLDPLAAYSVVASPDVSENATD